MYDQDDLPVDDMSGRLTMFLSPHLSLLCVCVINTRLNMLKTKFMLKMSSIYLELYFFLWYFSYHFFSSDEEL